ncbi:MAG: cystathionine gamma-synthase, partial [Mesorhizobium sp.]
MSSNISTPFATDGWGSNARMTLLSPVSGGVVLRRETLALDGGLIIDPITKAIAPNISM